MQKVNSQLENTLHKFIVKRERKEDPQDCTGRSSWRETLCNTTNTVEAHNIIWVSNCDQSSSVCLYLFQIMPIAMRRGTRTDDGDEGDGAAWRLRRSTQALNQGEMGTPLRRLHGNASPRLIDPISEGFKLFKRLLIITKLAAGQGWQLQLSQMILARPFCILSRSLFLFILSYSENNALSLKNVASMLFVSVLLTSKRQLPCPSLTHLLCKMSSHAQH